MEKYIGIVQIIVSVLLVALILLQSRGSGLGAVFGGTGAVYRTKRGIEKFLFVSTIVLAVVFLAAALASILIQS